MCPIKLWWIYVAELSEQQRVTSLWPSSSYGCGGNSNNNLNNSSIALIKCLNLCGLNIPIHLRYRLSNSCGHLLMNDLADLLVFGTTALEVVARTHHDVFETQQQNHQRLVPAYSYLIFLPLHAS